MRRRVLTAGAEQEVLPGPSGQFGEIVFPLRAGHQQSPEHRVQHAGSGPGLAQVASAQAGDLPGRQSQPVTEREQGQCVCLRAGPQAFAQERSRVISPGP